LAKTEYANADIDARHSAKELPLVRGRKRKLPTVLRPQKKGDWVTSPLGAGSNPPLKSRLSRVSIMISFIFEFDFYTNASMLRI